MFYLFLVIKQKVKYRLWRLPQCCNTFYKEQNYTNANVKFLVYISSYHISLRHINWYYCRTYVRSLVGSIIEGQKLKDQVNTFCMAFTPNFIKLITWFKRIWETDTHTHTLSGRYHRIHFLIKQHRRFRNIEIHSQRGRLVFDL
jgi:hypothetical protein